MNNKRQTLKKNQEKSFNEYKVVLNKSLVIGSVIATIIAITPYLFTLYEGVPKQRIWDAFIFKYDSSLWEDANYAMWVFTGKTIPLLLLFIWFFTCRHWWYHALLAPIAMYIFQILDIFSGDKYLDEFQLIYMIPIMALVIPSIYLIRAQIFNKINNADKSLEELEEEFKISPKNLWCKIKDFF